MEHRDEALNIFTTVEEETSRQINPTDKWLTLVDSRLKHLMVLHAGVVEYYDSQPDGYYNTVYYVDVTDIRDAAGMP